MSLDNKIQELYSLIIEEIKNFIIDDKPSEAIDDNTLSVNDYIIMDKRINRNAIIKTKPIDQIYKTEMLETKKTFEDIKKGKNLNISSIENFVNNALQDMTGNNNIISRIKQLKEDDDYTYRHSFNVSLLATNIGKWLGYSNSDLKDLGTAGLLFDIGKLKIPDHILNRPHQVTAKEIKIIQQHTVTGYNMLKSLNLSNNILMATLQHHENIDGSGYPLGLMSNKIHEFAKIIHICDMYDAMTTNKVYADKKSPFEAADIIRTLSGVTLDPTITFIFLSNISEFYSGSDVLLSDNSVGTIIHINPTNPTKPTIKVNNKFIDMTKNSNLKIVDII